MQYLQKRSLENALPFEPLGYTFLVSGLRKEDAKDYQEYIMGNVDEFSEERLQEMQVLETLYKLGFDAEAPGTYLFKEAIMKALHHLNGFDDMGRPISEEELLSEMEHKYSQFYLDVARNDLDIGIKTYHQYVTHALATLDYASVDPSVLSDIYGDFSEEADYGKHAFVIAKRMRAKALGIDADTKETGRQYVKVAVTTDNE